MPNADWSANETTDGAVCRHHSGEWLTTLLGAFDITATRTVPVDTMNGHQSTGIQILARAPGLRRTHRHRGRRTP